MKKSKIIVPALAMIAFSTAASIAGSVAWFTASRQVTVSAGTYAVVKTTTNLECHVASGVGTTATDGESNKTVSLNGNKLTDGSFNHKTGTVFTPNDAGSAIAKGTALTANNLSTELERATITGGKVYTAVTWGLTFTVSFGAQSGDYGLYLNATASSFVREDAATPETSDKTAKGFRIAFYPSTPQDGSEAYAKVYAGLQEFDNCSYVSSTSNFTGTAYVATDYDLVDSEFDDALPIEAGLTGAPTRAAATTQRADCLGIFGFQESTRVTLSYTAVAWFEGTDDEIVNRATADEYQSVIASLTFDAIKIADAPAPTEP